MTAPPPLGPADTVGDFQVPIRDVLALVPDALVVSDPEDAETTAYDRTRITYGQVAGWIEDVTAVTAVQLAGLSRLSENSIIRTTFGRAAASVVATGAASYLTAARFPEREGQGVDSYAKTLWDRYSLQLTALAASLTAVVDAGGTDVDPPPDGGTPTGGGGIAGSFPPPMFPDDMAW